ncbi:hypothetical protein [Novosphingobium terrae]|uniref:hypothetical protein n=1 Tax=Novosphingobium terrae TaxID=2726189 RepID=UPI00197FC3EF|nr:hypothetical protein [Novosphingobium terrae]
MRFNYPRNQGRPWIVDIGLLVDGKRDAFVHTDRAVTNVSAREMEIGTGQGTRLSEL